MTDPLTDPATPPLTLSFEVACGVDHAFQVWTSDIGSWWPTDHTVTGSAEAVVVLQSGVGGRIFERGADGTEYDWGQVTVWDPPSRLSYLWHIGRDRSEATEVDIRFVPGGADRTRVDIEHRGWERLGQAADERRAQNRGGWEALVPHYQTAAGNRAPTGR
jgi:Activator of Hsp90 ATPase homolog 1-like protein